MPTHKAFKKSIVKNEKRRIRNKVHKTKLKNIFKRAEKAESEEEKKTLLKEGYKIIDKACARDIIKKNKAARKKSRLAKILSV
ncbi:MAG: 30S ribosomal protein S20 [candidate division WOR-3 bacterium]|nr:30S ribosomal protein S20 [candidate division WOR-3 bacterium]